MRRSDREVTDRDDILKIITACDILRLGLCGEDGPYIVPMCFGILPGKEGLTLYLHSAGEGKKLDLLRRDGRACFEVDTPRRLVTGGEACSFSYEYESAVGFGTIEEVFDMSEKKLALGIIMEHYAPGRDFEFSDGQAKAVTVLRLSADTVTGKRSSPPGG